MSSSSYRGENSRAQSIVLFVIFFALFLGGIFALSFLSLESFAHAFVPAGAALLLCFLAYWVPMTIMGRSNSAGE
ncbi:hypothetical protein SAMN04489740_1975 [Arthrobacter alpinus]|uniref:Uncharacterized protein n=1 Tax=Arthrobacter alpinus TaxID=656366 RepID=A0A0U2XLI1_9MICC|nr:hypothetical protein [Arthrobacter alpinus]ALV44594.1 hypothetical protein MB46_02720 [Arthrobacter alpinus]SEE63100.1 hypothetical protein SAMN04489740_1975 [Arthrobacter alpinus]